MSNPYVEYPSVTIESRLATNTYETRKHASIQDCTAPILNTLHHSGYEHSGYEQFLVVGLQSKKDGGHLNVHNFYELDSDHMVMLSHPKELAEIINVIAHT